MLGVVIGVSTVMAMATIVSGVRDQIVDTIEIAGPTTFYVLKVLSQTPVNPQDLPAWIRVRPDLTTDDAERIAKLPEIKYAAIWGADSEPDRVRRRAHERRRRDGRRRRLSRDLRRRADRWAVVHALRGVERCAGRSCSSTDVAQQTVRRHSADRQMDPRRRPADARRSASIRRRRTSSSRPGRRSHGIIPYRHDGPPVHDRQDERAVHSRQAAAGRDGRATPRRR